MTRRLSSYLLVYMAFVAQTKLVAAQTAPHDAAVPATPPAAPAAVPAPHDAPAPADVVAPPPAPVAAAAAPPVVAPVQAPTAPEPKAPSPTTATPLKIESANASMKLGLLSQFQYEALESPDPALSGVSHNLYVRRFRVILGGTLFDRFEYFFDTDFPNLFKANAEGVKSTPGMNVQDAFVTYKAVGDSFKVDAGYMLPALSRNALQGATTLYSWDYFANSFRHSNAFGSSADPVGRDTGVQLRGLVGGGHLEYRVGAFQGLRRPQNMAMTKVGSRNSFRLAMRLQVNVLDPETGFFYAGSYLGTKSVLSFGASYELQDNYKHWSADGFVDLPLGPGNVTAQVNVGQWDGDDWLALPKQTAFMAEAGYRFEALSLGPILRGEHRDVKEQSAALPDETRLSAGLAFWPYGHNVNVKAFYTRGLPSSGLDDYNQFNLQWQLYFF